MIVERLCLSNFRCFGADATKLSFSGDVTSFIGGNGAGKTAALIALSRLFGVSKHQRTIQKSDFHIRADQDALADESLLYMALSR